MKVSTDWIKDYVKLPDAKIPASLERLTMAGLEVEKVRSDAGTKGSVFEVEVTTNRPDWLSHVGVAREMAAVEGLNLTIPEKDRGARAENKVWSVKIEASDACPYYTGVLIEGLQPAKTPDFMKKRLEACGVRCISLIVDITNYVLLETGQPLHAFDAGQLHGNRIEVRFAKKDEKFLAIDDSELKLGGQDLVIADSSIPVALAGVMGGKLSEVTEQTTNVLLESAFFTPAFVRRSSRKFGLTSESSYRFERRVDPEGVDFGRERALYLIRKYAKPKSISRVFSAGKKPETQRKSVKLDLSEVENVIGISLAATKIRALLTGLGLGVKSLSTHALSVEIPSFRSDLTRSVDLIEEIARLYGYDKIPETLPRVTLSQPPKNKGYKFDREIRNHLLGSGFQEAVTFSLISEQGLEESDLKDTVKIVNPQNKELSWMRPTLATSLLNVVQRNLRAGAKRVAFFEVANIYRTGKSKKSQPIQKKVVGLILSGDYRLKKWLDSDRPSSYYDIKGITEVILTRFGAKKLKYDLEPKSFLQAANAESVVAGKKKLGFMGEISESLLKLWDLEQPIFYAEIDLDTLLSFWPPKGGFEEIPKYPGIQRDLAVVVKESVRAGEVRELVFQLGENLIRDVEIFDLFRGGRIPKGNKNLAFRITYQSLEKTLVSDEIQALHTRIADAVVQQFQASFQ